MDYEEIRAEVEALLATLGRPVIFKKVGGPTDSNLPWSSSGVPTTIATTIAVFVPHTGPGFGMEFIPEDLLARTKEVCLVAHSGVDLTKADFVTDGVDCRVDWCYTLKPGATVLLYAFGIVR